MQIFIIIKVLDYHVSKEDIGADFEKFFDIVFPFHTHETEEVNQVFSEIEKKQVLPSYFLQFWVDCQEVSDTNMQLVKFENLRNWVHIHHLYCQSHFLLKKQNNSRKAGRQTLRSYLRLCFLFIDMRLKMSIRFIVKLKRSGHPLLIS